jgi:hypothetical protein
MSCSVGRGRSHVMIAMYTISRNSRGRLKNCSIVAIFFVVLRSSASRYYWGVPDAPQTANQSSLSDCQFTRNSRSKWQECRADMQAQSPDFPFFCRQAVVCQKSSCVGSSVCRTLGFGKLAKPACIFHAYVRCNYLRSNNVWWCSQRVVCYANKNL